MGVDPKRADRVFVDVMALAQEQAAEAQRLAAQWAAAIRTPAPAPPSASGGRADLVGELERLAALRERGVLSDSEFAAAKRALLARGGQG